jgi:hypothetical protein
MQSNDIIGTPPTEVREKPPRVTRRVSLGMMKSHSLTTVESKLEAAVQTLGLVTPRAKDELRKSDVKKLQRKEKDKNRGSEKLASSGGEASSLSSRKENRSTSERKDEKKKFTSSRNRSLEDSPTLSDRASTRSGATDSISDSHSQSMPMLSIDRPLGTGSLASSHSLSNASDASDKYARFPSHFFSHFLSFIFMLAIWFLYYLLIYLIYLFVCLFSVFSLFLLSIDFLVLF